MPVCVPSLQQQKSTSDCGVFMGVGRGLEVGGEGGARSRGLEAVVLWRVHGCRKGFRSGGGGGGGARSRGLEAVVHT